MTDETTQETTVAEAYELGFKQGQDHKDHIESSCQEGQKHPVTPTPMTHPCSTDLQEIGAALAKAQSDLGTAVLDGNNAFFGSRYATLNSCWKAAREALTKNGLSVLQPYTTDTRENGTKVIVRTILLHDSGQWFAESASTFVGSMVKGADGQKVFKLSRAVDQIGSTVTYLRRQGLCAMVGISPGEDDDGQGEHAAEGYSQTGTITKDQEKVLTAAIKKGPHTLQAFKDHFKVTAIGDIAKADLNDALRFASA